MRNMSFSLTQEQFKARTKTVTRRLGWKYLKPGELVQGVVKCMGLKPGEKIQPLGIIRIRTVIQEPLMLCTNREALLEGFPKLDGEGFIQMFCLHMKCKRDQVVTRIEFEYMEAK